MGIKEKLFIIFLVGVIVFPFFFTKKELKIEKEINLAYIIVNNASFKEYKNILEKEGSFKSLQFYNQNNFIANNINIKFLDKNSELFANKLTFDNIYHFVNAKYITNNYTYLAKKANYIPQTKQLIAYNFVFFNDKINGKGAKMIYEDNIVKADNIFYTIKGFK